MSDDVTVQLGTARTATILFEPICNLYDEAFSQPPFRWTNDESSHHRELLRSLSESPSFGISTAEINELLVGFAYGYALSSATQWWTGLNEPLPDEFTSEHTGRTFALIDLAVHRSWRRQGIGRRLVETLLASRNEERATLSVQPTAVDTQNFYRNLGWTKVGTKKMPPGTVSPVFDVYVIPLGENP